MINIWNVCKCGGEPKLTEKIYSGEDVKVYSECKKCGLKIVDIYKIKYKGRAYDNMK